MVFLTIWKLDHIAKDAHCDRPQWKGHSRRNAIMERAMVELTQSRSRLKSMLTIMKNEIDNAAVDAIIDGTAADAGNWDIPERVLIAYRHGTGAGETSSVPDRGRTQ